MVSKEKCFFTVDDLPTPVLVYSKKNGKILSWNKPARKLFGFNAKDTPSVYQLRGEFKSYSNSKKTDGGCIDLGVISHHTKKGTAIFTGTLPWEFYMTLLNVKRRSNEFLKSMST